MRTVDQVRAEFAWKRVNAVEPNIREKYRNLAKALPALVMTNGLMQSLAFLKGKADHRNRNEHDRLLNHLLEWLHEAQVIGGQQAGFEVAMAWCVAKERSTLDYQRATEETLAILRWVRYLADTV
jgi:CRISPR-associated protein Cmr5